MNLRPIARPAAALLLLATALPASAQQLNTPRPSPKAKLEQRVGLTDLSVAWSRPGVKGRTIWGDLVPWDQPWRIGANEATTFTTSDAIRVNGKELPAGTWAVVAIPGRERWTIAFNPDKEMWGTNGYKAEKDVLRVEVKPETTATSAEWLSFSFPEMTPRSAKLEFRWEKVRWTLDIEVEMEKKAMESIRAALAAAKPDDWRTPYRAASFCLDFDAACPEAIDWARSSVKIEAGYYNLFVLGRLEAKGGKTADAIATLQRAVEVGKAKSTADSPIDTKGAEKLLAELKAKK